MWTRRGLPSVDDMRQNSSSHPPPPPGPRPPAPVPPLSWPLVLGLGAVALVRPLARITGVTDGLGSPTGPVLLTVAVSAVWVLVVGLGRVPRPVLVLTLAGVAYAIAIVPLSAVLSGVLDGTVSGPLANPVAIVPVLLTNAAWGALAGLVALGVQHLRGTDRR